MQVAVIDDGINTTSYGIGALAFDLEVDDQYTVVPRASAVDRRSHGTVCAAIIRRYHPAAVLGSIKILHSETQTGHIEQLLAALRWCGWRGIKLVHLSAGTTLWLDFPKVRAAVMDLYRQGCVIVAAYHNRQIYTMPAAHPFVIGVQCAADTMDDQFSWACENGLNPYIAASGRHLLLSEYGRETRTEAMNSYAAPLVTARAARLLDTQPDASLMEVKKWLAAEAAGDSIQVNQVVSLDFFDVAVLVGKNLAARKFLYNCMPFEVKNFAAPLDFNNGMTDADMGVILDDTGFTETEFSHVYECLRGGSQAGVVYTGANQAHKQMLDDCGTFLWSREAYHASFAMGAALPDDIEIPVVCIYGGLQDIVPFTQAMCRFLSRDGYYAKPIGHFDLAFLYGFEYIEDTAARKDGLSRITQIHGCDIILLAIETGAGNDDHQIYAAADVSIVFDSHLSIPHTDDNPCIVIDQGQNQDYNHDQSNLEYYEAMYAELLRYLTNDD